MCVCARTRVDILTIWYEKTTVCNKCAFIFCVRYFVPFHLCSQSTSIFFSLLVNVTISSKQNLVQRLLWWLERSVGCDCNLYIDHLDLIHSIFVHSKTQSSFTAENLTCIQRTGTCCISMQKLKMLQVKMIWIQNSPHFVDFEFSAPCALYYTEGSLCGLWMNSV